MRLNTSFPLEKIPAPEVEVGEDLTAISFFFDIFGVIRRELGLQLLVQGVRGREANSSERSRSLVAENPVFGQGHIHSIELLSHHQFAMPAISSCTSKTHGAAFSVQ